MDKKTLIAVTLAVMLALVGGTYAQNQYDDPDLMGDSPGYGYECGGKGCYGPTDEEKKEYEKLLNETAVLRREIHTKRFDLSEALRKGEEENADALIKELEKLEEKLYEQAEPLFEDSMAEGPGHCGGSSSDN